MNHQIAATENMIHIIPEEQVQLHFSGNGHSSCKRRLTASSQKPPTSLVSLFDESANRLKELCKHVVKREAVAVRQQLSHALDKNEQREGQDILQQSHLAKRRRISISEKEREESSFHTQSHSQDEHQESFVSVSEEEQAVRQRAARMLHMASLVRNYQATMAQFRMNMIALEQEEG